MRIFRKFEALNLFNRHQSKSFSTPDGEWASKKEIKMKANVKTKTEIVSRQFSISIHLHTHIAQQCECDHGNEITHYNEKHSHHCTASKCWFSMTLNHFYLDEHYLHIAHMNAAYTFAPIAPALTRTWHSFNVASLANSILIYSHYLSNLTLTDSHATDVSIR